jgi:hypothetical protein
MSIAAERSRPTAAVARGRLPLYLLAVALAGVVTLLALPLSAPVGPMYWDVFIYYDAANRIGSGQVPVLDFFTPVGPLGYYLFAAMLAVFPDAQPTLLAHWSLLPLTAPLIAVVVGHVDTRSRAMALGLLVPFLLFALLPFNTRDYYPFPGSDGFGIYNRQVCQLLYVLVAALVFVRDKRLLATLVAVTVAALFFVKITGFVAALILCGFAFLSGRLPFLHAAAAALAFLALLAGLELWNGLVSQYVADILALVAMNSDSLAPRILQAASHTFGVLAPAGALILLLAWWDRRRFAERFAAWRASPRPAAFAALVDHNALWLGVTLLAGLVFETQNTGSQAMVFVWPVLLAILLGTGRMIASPKVLVATFALAAAASLPVMVNTAERAARAYVGAVRNLPLEHANLKSLGSVTMRPEIADRAQRMIGFYPRHAETYRDFVGEGILPSFVQYSDFDFQVTHLMAVDEAIDALREFEARNGLRFETIMTLNFVNVFPWLMDRAAPRHIAIGADPTRAVPQPGSREADAVGDVDLALMPTCPPTTANEMLWRLYEPMLAGHRRIALTPCYDAFVHPRLADRIP